MTRLGSIVHEMGHFLGLPDLNDLTRLGKGLGNFDVMGNPYGFDSTLLYPPGMYMDCGVVRMHLWPFFRRARTRATCIES